MNKLENLKKKILYRASYRGTKEMDILLTSFVKKHINSLCEEELNELEIFLNFEDEIIYKFYQNNESVIELKKNKIANLLSNFKI